MGQEIFYCGSCKNLLRSRDLEKGGAVRSGDQVYCRDCAVNLPGAEAPVQESFKPHPDETPRPKIGSARTPRAPLPPASKSPAPLIAGAVGGLVVLALLLALAFGGASGKSAPKKDPVVVEVAYIPPPPPPPPPTPPTREPRPDPRPKPLDREGAARRLIEEARAVPAEDVDGRLERARRALLEAEGTALAEDARRLEEESRKRVKERDDKKRSDMEVRLKDALAAERYGEAIGILELAKDETRAADVRRSAEAAWKEAAGKLLDARRRGAEAEAKALCTRIETWGVDSIKVDLAKALSQPVAVVSPPDVLAYRKRWTEPWALSLPFDYAAAVKELEKGASGAAKAEAAGDLEAVRLASEVAREAPLLLQKAVKGQDLRLERFDEDGGRSDVAGKLLRTGPLEVVVWTGEGALAVPLAEFTPAAWAEFYRGRSAKKPTDARACQIYCLLEGDPEGAGRFANEPVPPGPAEAAARAVAGRRAPSEAAARKAFAEAEQAFQAMATRLASGPAYAALLKQHGSTAFVRRAKGLIEERLQEAQEAFLGADEIQTAGLFAGSEALKGVACVLMTADAPPGRGPENYAQFELAAPGGDIAPRCWVYAGGCCAEVMAFGVQAPELAGVNPRDAKEPVTFEPGGPFAAPVKPPSSLKAKHSSHMGPKEPSKWAWVQVPLPKYAAPGVRKIRLVAEQQGFSIAYVWISAGRPGPPREAALKELERARSEIEALSGSVPVQTGTLLREWWLNVQGSKIPELLAAPGYPDRPTGSGSITSFEGPSTFGENYGTRVRGYVHPPLNGNYVFFLATDDDSELWISSDENPGRRRKVAGVLGSTNPREWDSQFAGKSVPIPLKAGKRYYVELLHKEGNIDDHFAVGWQLPDGSMERPVPGNRLSPWMPSGRGSRSGLYRAINFNGPPLVVDGRPWEGKEAPQLTVSGEAFENQSVPLEPAVDGPKAQMLRASIFARQGLVVTMHGVPAGKYQVYAYFWEDNASQTFDILLNGRVIREKFVSGAAGHWEKLGPWAVEVADGNIELRTTPGDANLSGLEIWRLGR